MVLIDKDHLLNWHLEQIKNKFLFLFMSQTNSKQFS